ncbi:type II toxin-antitoxin system YafQ family toxin [Streptococcus pantholopis]|uniref:mRNA interferase YafQ n=1 Tax=Streptococcus pantholopis TaxID=1811193 RepID=A0A172Q4Y7_9STRE|nr:type II toxin-antitoxin system YafQ family toxin [Streptococcus pantholopis]AND78519.1 mRNA interferase YafQ [Streptococcus pantholopis]
MLKIKYHNQFKKDYKLALRRGFKASKLEEVLEILVEGNGLPEKYRDHQLTVSKYYKGVRECHIQPDWLLIYRIDDDKLILNLLRTGSHSDLF